jgi:hypothetical protein
VSAAIFWGLPAIAVIAAFWSGRDSARKRRRQRQEQRILRRSRRHPARRDSPCRAAHDCVPLTPWERRQFDLMRDRYGLTTGTPLEDRLD